VSSPVRDLGSKRYRQTIAELTRTRMGIMLETVLDPTLKAQAIAEIDRLAGTLSLLQRQKEAEESRAANQGDGTGG
jgi:hypothetical protein